MEQLLNKAKQASQEDIDELCSSIDEFLPVANKSGECCELMCELFVIIQASEPNSEPCISEKLIHSMIKSLKLVALKSQGGGNRCRLCQMILSELLPLNEICSETIGEENVCISLKSLHFAQGISSTTIKQISLTAKEWLESDDFEKNKAGLLLIILSVIRHVKGIDVPLMEFILEKIVVWLSSSSLLQAANPYAINPFRKDNENAVTEVDGSSNTNIFTILSIGQYYSEDQILNIWSFSVLFTLLAKIVELRSKDDFELSPTLKKNVTLMIDFCLRIFDQCELKTKVQCDSDLQLSCLTECVHILDSLCVLDKDQTARVFHEVKKLYSQLVQENPASPTLIHILQFILNHSSSVVYAPQESYKNYFTSVIAKQFCNDGLMYDTLELLCKNLHHITHNTEILTDYFPNLFKILAWHPRLFIKEFTVLLPAMMNMETSVELLHLILDLPCMTATLEVIERSKKEELSSYIGTEPASSIEAFYSVRYRPLFNYMTRCESHQGDTIDRLVDLHSILKDVKGNTRVMVCCQLVPVLLRIWFDIVESYGDASFISLVIPVILERSGMLYSVPELIQDILKILADKLLKLCKAFPLIISFQYLDIIEFLQTTVNMNGRIQIYTNLIYAVGEYGSQVNNLENTTDKVGQFYECLEILTYELLSHLSFSEFDTDIAKVLSALMSSLTKLACRSHDLIPRAILCLTKVTKQQNLILLSSSTKEILTQRATSLISLMKISDTGSSVVTANPEICHLNNTSKPSILRGLQRLLT